MAFTYDPDNLSEPINYLRLLIQDTDETNVLLQDSEVLNLAGDTTNKYRAAANICRVIAAKFAQKANVGDKDIQINNNNTAREYRLLAADHDKKADAEDLTKTDDPGSSSSTGGVNFPTMPGGDSIFTRNLHLQ